MTEEERLISLEKIKKMNEKKRECIRLRSELEKLKKDDKVKRYLELTKEIDGMGNYHRLTDEIVCETSFSSTIRESNSCKHTIWVYLGSYYNMDDYERSYDVKVNNESDPRFEYNIYFCPECNNTFITSDYKKFESENFVLKRYGFINQYKIREYYFKLLTSNKVEDANKKLIKAFNERNI